MSMDPAQRIAKWNAKFNTERIKGVLDDMRDRMYANVQAVFPMLCAMELQVKQVLDGQGVVITSYPFYLAFAREVWSLKRKEVSGESLAIEVATLLGKWVSRGYSQSVLEAIRTQVFDVSAPVGP